MKEHIWGHILQQFQDEMLAKIKVNMREKGTSWITPSKAMKVFLENKLREYYFAEKWVDVANIAFMLWDREKEGV